LNRICIQIGGGDKGGKYEVYEIKIKEKVQDY
jgi:hypothetical protein